MRFHDVIKAIDDSKKIAITYHVSPDGDALGSALALLQGIKNYGKEAYVISKDLVSDNLSFLPYSGEITGKITSPLDGTDCVIVVDCGNYERISADLENFKGLIINIDHHLSNDRYGDINYVNVDAAATSEIIYELLNHMNVEISKSISECIYTSIMTDTGSFRFSNTSKRTHNIVGELLGNGVNQESIHRSVFDNKSFEKLKLIGLVLDDMELICNGNIVFMRISKDMINKVGIKLDDSGDIISLGNQIKGVKGAILAKEVDGGIKLSLRSKDTLDVRRIAENFGGGGHTKAAGAFLESKSLDEAKNMIINLFEKS